jgi:hypothetical protein
VVGAGSSYRDHGAGFSLVLAAAIRAAVMVLMGYDPEDKAKLEEMQKDAGKMYALSFVASLVSAAVLAKIIAITTVNSAFYGMKVGFAVWLGFVTTVQLTQVLFAKQPAKLYSDQYWLSTGLLFGDGSNSSRLAVVIRSVSTD